jgi:hypothetical protein
MDTVKAGKLIRIEEALNRRETERRWAQSVREGQISCEPYEKRLDPETSNLCSYGKESLLSDREAAVQNKKSKGNKRMVK